ncbi:MAG TPA: cell division protein FtsL [Steroidobacteraceae bacterium]|nr:cell division protein FtsL [Steroidobacteraceae bacterium]
MVSVLKRPWTVVLLLWCAVLVSATGAVWTRHRARELFVELEQLNRDKHALDVAWGQWQLEQSFWSQHAQVESTARRRLGMTMPDPVAIQVVLP